MVNIFFPKKNKIKNAPRGQMNRTIKVFQTALSMEIHNAPCDQWKSALHRVVNVFAPREKRHP